MYPRALLLMFFMSLACVNACFLQKRRIPDKVMIPNGFKGWVRIYYETSGAAALTQEDGYNIIKVPQTGVFYTSSIVQQGVAQDTYLFSDGQKTTSLYSTVPGKGGMIWGNKTEMTFNNKTLKKELIYQTFFVGSEDEFENAKKLESR